MLMLIRWDLIGYPSLFTRHLAKNKLLGSFDITLPGSWEVTLYDMCNVLSLLLDYFLFMIRLWY
jgi:hypothetical protein